MNRTLIAGAALAVALGTGDHLCRLHLRLAQLEQRPEVRIEQVALLARELGEVQEEARTALVRAEDLSVERALAERYLTLAAATQDSSAALERLDGRLDRWESRWSDHAPEEFLADVRELRSELEQRSGELDLIAGRAAQLAEDGGQRLDELAQQLEPLTAGRDVDGMWNELVGPVVQLAGDVTVGSGVLLESRPAENGEWLTYLVTSWHVVRDIYGSVERVDAPVPVKMYLPGGGFQRETAHMVAYDVDLDIALLTLDSNERVAHGARLASRERVASVRIFDPIYAVGCPLGNDPIPTPGEVAATQHEVEGGEYWMISAPTYIGNSGGGIFDAGSHELLGIFSKIYTHGSMRTTIVPHMGLVTPLGIVYAWLDDIGEGQVVDAQLPVGIESAVQTASAVR